MSYQIEFTGSLVDNRDVPQVTTNSSLVKTDLVSPSSGLGESNWLWNTQPNGTVIIPSGIIPLQLATGIYSPGANGQNGATVTTQGGVLCGQFSAPNNNTFIFRSTVPANNTINVNFRLAPLGSNPSLQLRLIDSLGNQLASSITIGFIGGAAGFYSYNIFAPSNVAFLDAGFTGLGGMTLGFEFLRFEVSSSIAATPSTITQGVQKVGGTLATETIVYEEVGQPEISEPPELHGLVTKDGLTTVSKSLYLPSAGDTIGAKKDVKSVKIITTQTDTLTTEAIGLGGSETLDAKSSILVEDVEAKGEN